MGSPLIVHVIHRLGVGGLENGVVNLINHLPVERYRHALVCLTEATDFRCRLHRDILIYEMHKREGQDLGLYVRFYRLLKKLRPAIVHTRNLATLECQLPAWIAGVPGRIHGEHGWDVFDPEGKNPKYLWLRRAFRPLIHRYIALSRQLEDYLVERVGVPSGKITRICNGVDTGIFHPPKAGREPIPGCPFTDPSQVLIGTVGRMHGVKDQTTLVRSFIQLIAKQPDLTEKIRLLLIGDGPLRLVCHRLLEKAGLEKLAWLPGERDDIPTILRGLDLFVLPSQAEGISNTLLEAMATGLPVVATRVGGNPELVMDQVTGTLVPPGDPETLAQAVEEYVALPEQRRLHGDAGYSRAHDGFALSDMMGHYQRMYDMTLGNR